MEGELATADASTSHVGLLRDIAVAVNEATTTHHVLEAALRSICKATGWSVGHALLCTPDGGLESAGIWHVADHRRLGKGFEDFRLATEARCFMPGEGLPGQVLHSGLPTWVTDTDKDDPFLRRALARKARLASCFAVPVLSGNKVVAVLEYYAPTPQPPSAKFLEVMEYVGLQLGLIFERVQAYTALTVREQCARQILDSARDAFIGIDTADRITAWNLAAEETFGWTHTEVLGKSLTETIVPVQYRHAHRRGLERYLASEVPHVIGQRLELSALHRNGHEFPIEITLWSQKNYTGLSFYAFARDITQRKEAECKLKRRALHDPLTGLPNRALMVERLQQLLDQRDHIFAVLFIDLDHFKRVNDMLGHEAGDQVLIEVVSRLDRVLRSTDILARFTGDEFVAICPEVDTHDAAAIIAQRLLSELVTPIHVKDDRVFLTASIGIALAEPMSDAETLISSADIAMYEAKSSGRAHFELFDQRMQFRVATRMNIESDLRKALDRGQLRLYFQPILSTRDNLVVSVETLLRWEHPDRGMLPPAEFIPIAEETGLIIPIGAWVLEEACRQAQSWGTLRTAGTPLWVSVNLSARQLAQADLVATIERILAVADIDPARIQFGLEVTETVVMRDPENAAETLRALRALGVHLSIDDFGTGYSSLAYLKRFPVDTVKVDRAFVQAIQHDTTDQAIVGAVTELAHLLGLSVVAEGVETPEQARTLTRIGVDYVQGFLYARPQPPEHLEAMLRKQEPPSLVRCHTLTQLQPRVTTGKLCR